MSDVMLSAAILAGGRAVRFDGRDKGTLVVDGRSIRARQIAALSAITSDLLVIGSRGHGDDRAPFDDPLNVPVRVLADRVPGCGPLGGLHTALLEASGRATAVVACDMPYITAPLIDHLLSLTRDADAVVPRTARGYHPLCAAYTRACLEPVARRLAERRLKMTDLLADLRVREVAPEELRVFGDVERLLANVNSPHDYRDLLALQSNQL